MTHSAGASDGAGREPDGAGRTPDHGGQPPARPPRPELYVGQPPPRLTPPEPPGSQRLASGAWKAAAAALGLSLGMAFLDLGDRREHVRTLVTGRAPDTEESVLRRAIDIVFWGGLGTWGVLALASVFVGWGMVRPRVGPRLWGLLLAVLLVPVVLLTVALLVPDSGPVNLGARVLLGAGALAAVLGALLGLDPRSWRWVREYRHE